MEMRDKLRKYVYKMIDHFFPLCSYTQTSWSSDADYMFFRNNMPSLVKLGAKLVSKNGTTLFTHTHMDSCEVCISFLINVLQKMLHFVVNVVGNR